MVDISFSQAQTWKLCKRKWSFDKVNKRIGIPGMAAVRGTRYHEAIEELVKEDKQPINEILARAVAIFSRLKWENVKPEVYMEAHQGEHKLRGYADIVAEKEGKKIVLDWKFPGKHPGRTPRSSYIDQIQLYAWLLDANQAVLAFPEHDTAFTFEADSERGHEVAQHCFDVAGEITSSGALEIPGELQQATPNYLCKSHCSHRDVCPLGG